jgi:Zn-dependent protease with chaperone function
MNFFSYWFSDKLVLKMYNAQGVDETSAPQFYRMVRELAGRAGLPMPRVYLIEEDAPERLSRPAATRRTRPWPRPPASCACSASASLRGCDGARARSRAASATS